MSPLAFQCIYMDPVMMKKGGKDTSGDRDRKGKGKYMGVMIWGHKKRGKSVSVRSSSQLELTTEAGYLQK